jgi:hypothetical protein
VVRPNDPFALAYQGFLQETDHKRGHAFARKAAPTKVVSDPFA